MGVALQIKDVREEVRDAIAARAAATGQSMQTYLKEILEREFRAERNKSLFDDLATHRSLSLDVDDVVGLIRAGRESDRQDDV
jgi:antitoxin FitA